MCRFSENSAQLYQSYGILMLKACKGVDFFSIGRVCYQWKLEDTARYAGFLLALVEDFYAGLAYFRSIWCSIVTSVTLISNLSNFEEKEKNLIISIKIQNKLKIKKSEN